MVGLHANTPECIVELRELQKCIIQVRGMERGEGGERERGMKAGHAKKKKRSEIEALRAKNVRRGGRKSTSENIITSMMINITTVPALPCRH